MRKKKRIASPPLREKGIIAGPDTLPAIKHLTFSFKYLDLMGNPKFGLHRAQDGYAGKLLERFREVSKMTLCQFVSPECRRTLRSHSITFAETSEPGGFAHLPAQLRTCTAWQFALSANAHGRVHGIIISETFYVIWLDPSHQMYPEQMHNQA